MKQAILIGAYKNHDQLLKLVSLFPAEHFNIYIHLNRIGEIDVNQFRKDTSSLNHVHVFSEYKIKWGGRNHLLAYLSLAEHALKNDENYFFHYITGQDLPVKPIAYFLNELDTSKDYIQKIPFPVSYLPNGAQDWFEYYLLFDLLDSKKYLKYIKLFKVLQIKLGIKRDFKGFFQNKFYASAYWSLKRDTLSYVVSYSKNHPDFLARLKFTFAAEEIYFSTVIMNSPYSQTIHSDNLRFMKWENKGKGGSPKILDESDFEEIEKTKKLFARKFNSNLIDKVLSKFFFN